MFVAQRTTNEGQKNNFILSEPKTLYLNFSGMRSKDVQQMGSWLPICLGRQLLKTPL